MLFAFVLLLGCELSSEPARPTQSTPLMSAGIGGGKVDMVLDAEGPKPIGVDALLRRFERLQGAAVEHHTAVAAALNVVMGPCEICDGKPLAHCAIDHPSSCPVVNDLAARAVGLAERGIPAEQIKVAINYPDRWFPKMGRGVPVTIHLWRDAEGSFQAETQETQSALEARFGDSIQWVVHEADAQPPNNLDVRSRPTWFINGHRFRGAHSATSLGRFVQFETVLVGQ